MRSLVKKAKPAVLAAKEAEWLAAFKADQTNEYRRTKYRHPEIKKTLKEETGSKCIYCESKIGHNTPGDVEHMVPTSKDAEKHFDWANLTIACTECNRRKNDYLSKEDGFLDPYRDNVESMLDHLGPLVHWIPGAQRGEVSVKILELSNAKRIDLIARKAEKLEEVASLLERHRVMRNSTLRGVLQQQLQEMAAPLSEYSGMVLCALKQKGFL